MTDTKIILKKSNVPDNAPTGTQLDIGEVALNFPDRKLYTKTPTGTIIELGSQDQIDLELARFDTTTTIQPAQGQLTWNGDWGTLEQGMNGGEVTYLLGQEELVYVRNTSGATIPKGVVVMATGTVGQSSRITVGLMIADGTVDSKFVIGIAKEPILNNEDGYVATLGLIRGLDTSVWANGTVLWANPATPGGLTSTRPQAPNLKLPIAIVVNSHANVGAIYVRVTTGSDLGEDHRVELSNLQDGHALLWNATTGRFENKTVPGAIIYTAGDGLTETAGQFAVDSSVVRTSDSRLTDSREWTASTISQVEAETGTETTRRAFTAQRVRQAILGWWTGSADKTKLDGIEAGAQVNVATNLGYTTAASTGTVTSSTGTSATLPAATSSIAGLMTNTDKSKLDGVATGATANTGTVTSIATNNGVTGGTITTTGTIGLTGQALALHNLATNGIIARTGAGTVAARTITASTGISVTNGNGVSGNPTITNTAPHQATNLGNTTNATTVTVTSSTGTNTTLPAATTTNAGVFVAADKTKLDGIAAGAQVNVATNLGYTAAASNGTVTSSTGTSATVPAATTSLAGLLTSADKTKLDGIAAGAQVNTVTSVAGKTGVVTLVASDVGLGNVTNHAQVRKLSSSTSGNVPTWDGTTGDQLAAGYGVETTLTGSASNLPRADAVKNYVDGLLSANDAMVYKGTLGTGGTYTALPTTYNIGWTIRVITAGTYAGQVAEVGDLFVAVVSRSGSGNLNSDWTVVQTNIDGAVTGPASSTDNHVVLFNGTSGKTIKSSGVVLGAGTLTLATSGIATGSQSFGANQNTNATFTVNVPGTNIAQGTRTATSVPITSSTGTNGALDIATTTLAGVMSSADKTKLDGIAAGAQVNVATDLSYTSAASTGTVNSSTGTNATIPAATTSIAGLLTSSDKTKLDGIATGATANTGTVTSVAASAGTGISVSGSPITTSGTLTITNTAPHQATNLGITGTGDTRTITSSTGTDVTIPVATTTTAGWLSTSDKTKLDGIAAGAQVNVATNLGYTSAASTGTVTSSTGTSATLPAATTSIAGLLTSADKTKLDGIATGATANTGTVTSVAASAGTGISISGSPITTSGTLTITNTAPHQATNLGITGTGDTRTITSSTGTDVTIPVATTTTAGWLSTADKTKLDGIAANANNYTLPTATSSVTGGVRLGSDTAQATAANAVTSTAARSYAIQANASGQLLVNVPWVDTNTTYTAGNGISLSSTTFSVAAGTGLTQDAGGLSLTAITAGAATVGALRYNGTTRVAGQLYGNTTNPTSTTRLNYDGHLHVNNLVAVGDVNSSSDERLKTNWRELPEDFLARLAEVRYGVYDRTDIEATQAGVSAQSLREVLPEAVSEDEEGYLSVNYGQAAMVAVIELTRQVKELQEELRKLKQA
jgi:hypothetical protein